MKIGLVYDLRTDYLAEGFTKAEVAEFDSESTIRELAGALRRLGHRVDRVGHGRALCRRLARGDRWDLVFTVAEGVKGRSREAQVPAILELFDIPYTFSDPMVCAVTLDKAVCKRLVADGGLRTPRFRLVENIRDIAGLSLRYPLFAKPVAEGTGKGVDDRSKITHSSQLAPVCRRLLRTFRQPVLVEEYLPGREFTTGLLGTGAEARVLGTLEVRARAHAPTRIYSYEMKEKCEEFVDYLPVKKNRRRGEIEALALAAHRRLECRDASRVDIRLDAAGRPSFMEVNPLPGLHPTHSDLPMIATQEGLPYGELIGAIVRSARRRTSRHGTGS
jgi:D-alanine-D-alanine ligase